MKLRLTILATAVATLAVPAAASAATLTVKPKRACYGSGHVVNLLGTGFTRERTKGVRITRDGDPLGEKSSVNTDATGAFNATLDLGQPRGRRTSIYTATDTTDPMLTASTQITVTALSLQVGPLRGIAGNRINIRTVGFTSGETLWAHVRRGNRTRNLRIGRLKGPCHRLRARRRLIPRRPSLGTYSIQFDTFRKYQADRDQRRILTVTVTRDSPRRPGRAAAVSLD
jgi:hypothetical protein